MSQKCIQICDKKMKVVEPVKNRILNKLSMIKSGVATIADLSDLGRSDRIRQALSRLVKEKRLLRIHPGVYALPGKVGLLGQPIHPRFEDSLRKWAKKNGVKIMPSGAVAANLLGLSTQVPMRMRYFTSGRRRTVMIDGIKTLLLPRSGIVFNVPGKVLPWIVQAVRYMGKDSIDMKQLKRIIQRLPVKDKLLIAKGKDIHPQWVRTLLQEAESRGIDG